MPQKGHANSAHFRHALMDYHVQTMYATNRPSLVKTPPPIAPVPMIHAPQVNAWNPLVGVISAAVPHWIRGRA